ncbi:hypothetical protein L861_02245 [Litchfieldella anticariensis FP35 = DSM 16096]|uniref:Uncharacterized protein n=1 Tax=Litchfieldella anticariensis (strain DSM 16096 / CECT 5854 / CIP 108499 / LMG 22089 / FP35) TaxID=1121939 RepID=S2L8I3_LITA3|nr:glycosyltransferase family 4 protein [Halomonas anticariensis]EPC04154.1 hypothetical protein L861_02245 [Halomonas anticariensis FP35 = DSM 16096]
MSDIIFWGVTPPPTTGMTIVNEFYREFLSQKGGASIVIKRKKWHNNIVWRINKYLYYFLFIPKLYFYRLKGYKKIYMAPDSSLGFYPFSLSLIFLRPFFKFIFHHHVRVYIESPTKLNKAFFNHFLSSGDCNIFLSREMQEAFSSAYTCKAGSCSLGNILLFPPVEPGEYLEDSTLKVNIGFISNITKEKGGLDFFEIIESLSQISDDFNFHLAGPCNDKEIIELIEQAKKKYGGRFKYYGALYDDAKWGFYRGVDILLFPSRYKKEAQPLVIYEAMASGCHVVARDIGYIRGQVENLGTLFNENDEAIEFINDLKSQGISKNAMLEAYNEIYTNEFVGLENIYEDLKGSE